LDDEGFYVAARLEYSAHERKMELVGVWGFPGKDETPCVARGRRALRLLRVANSTVRRNDTAHTLLRVVETSDGGHLLASPCAEVTLRPAEVATIRRGIEQSGHWVEPYRENEPLPTTWDG